MLRLSAIGLLFFVFTSLFAQNEPYKEIYISPLLGWSHGFSSRGDYNDVLPNITRGISPDNKNNLNVPLRKILSPTNFGFTISKFKTTHDGKYTRNYIGLQLNYIVTYRFTIKYTEQVADKFIDRISNWPVEFRPLTLSFGQSKAVYNLYTDSKQKKLIVETMYGVGFHYLSFLSERRYNMIYDSLQYTFNYQRQSPIGITVNTGLALQIKNNDLYGFRLEILYNQGLNTLHQLQIDQIKEGEIQKRSMSLNSRASNITLNISYPLFRKRKG